MTGHATEPPVFKTVFESWGAYLDHAENAKSPFSEKERASRRRNGQQFTGTRTFQEAMELAAHGWEEGAKKSDGMAEAMFADVSSMIERTDVVYDIEGSGIDVARFLNGEPECWQKHESVTLDGMGHKIIRMVFNGGALCHVSAKSITCRGAAVLATVELLEYAGHRVELWYTTASTGYGRGHHESWVLLKRAQDNLDKNRLAFALAHPAMLRRLQFSCWETMPKNLCDDYGIPHSGYGRTTNPQGQDCGDIFIATDMDIQWDDTKAVEKWIIQQLKDQGVHTRKQGATA